MASILHSTKLCPVCGSRDTFRLTMTVAGAPTAFTSCTICEWKGWEREGERLPLGKVLALVSTR
jgi:formate dehydrogenase maturation protein FdhE